MTDLRTLFHQLVRLEIELWDGLDQRLQAELGLSMGTLDVLLAIRRTPNARVQDVARELSITVGGTSKSIDRIEAAGHCARTPNPQDRRSSIIELTPAGADLLERALVIFDAELDQRLGTALPPEHLTQLSAWFATLRTANRTAQERKTT